MGVADSTSRRLIGMTLGTARERSGSELVFALLRTLMIGYQLWGVGSGLDLAELPAAMRSTHMKIGPVLRYLSREGLVHVDEVAGTVRLSDSGARHLLGVSGA